MYINIKISFRKTLAASLALLLVVGCLLSACTGGNDSPSQLVSEGYSLQDLPDWYGYSWVRDTEFNSLDTQEQLSRIITVSLGEYFWTQINAIKVAPNEDVYAAGLAARSESDSATALITRCDSNLNLIKSVEVPNSSSCATLEVDTEGNIYVPCETEDGKYLIVKYSSELDEICRQEVEPNASFTSIGFADDGSLYMCGNLGTPNVASDAIIAKYSTELELVGYQTWSGEYKSDNFTRLSVAVDGSVFVIGDTQDEYPLIRPVLRKYSADLSFLAEVSVEPAGTHDRFIDLALAPNGSVYTVLSSYDSFAGNLMTVIKYTSALEELGTTILADEVTSVANLPSQFRSFFLLDRIVVDRNGLVYCLGYQNAFAGSSDTRDFLVVIVLSDELSILNVALLAILPINNGFNNLAVCLSDNADLYIAGCYVDFSTEPTCVQIVK